MRHTRLVLPLALALTFGSQPSQAIDAFFPEFGNNGYDVRHYALDLKVDPTAHKLDGLAKLTVRATSELKNFALDLAGLTARTVRVNGKAASFTQGNGKLRIKPATPIKDGARFTVEVAYGGKPAGIDDPTSDDATLLPLGWLDWKKTSYVASEPVGASTWYPVNDEPTDKASYKVAITVAKPYTAVSNGVLKSVTDLGSSRRFRWEQSQPMASYLAIADVGLFDVKASGLKKGVPFRVYTPSGTSAATKAAIARTPEMVKRFEELIGPYPFSSYGSIVIKDPELYYALETQAMTTFPDDIDEATVAHELAHQWFGDSVTVAQWRDLWLAEGFATYFEYTWQYPGKNAFNKAMQELYDRVVENKVGPAVVSKPEDIFADNTYDRGALTLHALRLRIGNETFFRTLRTFHDTYKSRNATSADFIKVAVQVSHDPGVKDLLHTWLYEEAVPPLGTYQPHRVAGATARVEVLSSVASRRRR